MVRPCAKDKATAVVQFGPIRNLCLQTSFGLMQVPPAAKCLYIISFDQRGDKRSHYGDAE